MAIERRNRLDFSSLFSGFNKTSSGQQAPKAKLPSSIASNVSPYIEEIARAEASGGDPSDAEQVISNILASEGITLEDDQGWRDLPAFRIEYDKAKRPHVQDFVSSNLEAFTDHSLTRSERNDAVTTQFRDNPTVSGWLTEQHNIGVTADDYASFLSSSTHSDFKTGRGTPSKQMREAQEFFQVEARNGLTNMATTWTPDQLKEIDMVRLGHKAAQDSTIQNIGEIVREVDDMISDTGYLDTYEYTDEEGQTQTDRFKLQDYITAATKQQEELAYQTQKTGEIVKNTILPATKHLDSGTRDAVLEILKPYSVAFPASVFDADTTDSLVSKAAAYVPTDSGGDSAADIYNDYQGALVAATKALGQYEEGGPPLSFAEVNEFRAQAQNNPAVDMAVVDQLMDQAFTYEDQLKNLDIHRPANEIQLLDNTFNRLNYGGAIGQYKNTLDDITKNETNRTRFIQALFVNIGEGLQDIQEAAGLSTLDMSLAFTGPDTQRNIDQVHDIAFRKTLKQAHDGIEARATAALTE